MAAFSVQERGTNEYRVVTVGHSLAAGVAALVAILLRHEYPTIHCYAYSPPGCVLRFVCLLCCIVEDWYSSLILRRVFKTVQSRYFASLP